MFAWGDRAGVVGSSYYRQVGDKRAFAGRQPFLYMLGRAHPTGASFTLRGEKKRITVTSYTIRYRRRMQLAGTNFVSHSIHRAGDPPILPLAEHISAKS